MVGRLVQQQDVRIAEKGLRQEHAHLLLGGELCHLHGVLILGNAQPVQQAGSLGFGIPAVHLRKLSLQLGSLHAVLIGEVRLGVKGILLVHDFHQTLVAHHDSAQHFKIIIGIVVLLEHRQALTRSNFNIAPGGLNLTGQELQEGGLACSIGADDAVTVARSKLQVHILIKHTLAKLQTHIVGCNHWLLFILFFIQAPGGKKLLTQHILKHGQDALAIGMARHCPSAVQIFPTP